MDCAENARETCGGFDALTLYEIVSEAPLTPAPSTPPGPTPAPASPVVTSGDYDFVGRVMPVGPLAEDVMSAEICFGICSAQDNSYTHFGTKYGEEVRSLGTTETSTACTMDCAENNTETCGGFDALSGYDIVADIPSPPSPAPTLPNPPTPAPASIVSDDYEVIGCVADSQAARVMPVGPLAEATMSAEVG
ncbi:unnamed protein product, partial [Ectocarpus sp. 13 AM-2016]